MQTVPRLFRYSSSNSFKYSRTPYVPWDMGTKIHCSIGMKWRPEMPLIHLCKLSVRYIGAHRRCKISCKYSAISIVPSFKYFALCILCLKKSRSAREFSSQDTHAFKLCRGPRKPCSRAIFKENFFGQYWSSSHSKGAVPLRMFAPDWSLRPSFLFSSWDKLLYNWHTNLINLI